MRIVLGDVIGTSGKKEGEIVIHTEVSPTNKSVSGGVTMDTIQYLKGLHNGTINPTSEGWDQPSTNPNYPGKTWLQVAIAEIIRLNDAASRATLGV